MTPTLTPPPRVRTAAPMGQNRRVSPDSAWPLRAADGLTWAERKERERARNA